MSIIVRKAEELYLKLDYMITYFAPWSFSWGMPLLSLAAPLGIPHAALVLFQLLFSCIISAPIFPLMGSPLYFISYGRPVKYWERNYSTKRIDSTKQKLSRSLYVRAAAVAPPPPFLFNLI